MNKLNAEQILAIIEENYEVYNYAMGEWCETREKVEIDKSDFETIQKEKDDFYKSIEESLPSNWSERREHPDFIKYQEMPSKYDAERQQILDKLGLGKIVEVDHYGGEGEGEYWQTTKHFVDHDVYIKTVGHYTSYEGTEFYNGYGKSVTPKKKTITVYE